MASSTPPKIPSSVLIIGSGVFGLSTAWELCKNPLFKDTQITLVDRQSFPAADSSSIDTSRIIRPDYASPPYARLASTAQTLWRTTFARSHYHETGLCITASGPEQQYVSSSLLNVQSIGTDKLSILDSPSAIQIACGLESNACSAPNAAPGGGSTGYVNWSSGWANAEGAMVWLRREIEEFERVKFVVGTVRRLDIDHADNSISGAILSDNTHLTAELTILAAGAWTPSLLDLRGICKATGQTLVYLPISDAEQERMGKNPTILNLSSGLFIITPSANLLKIARHGHGYTNPSTIPHPESRDSKETITISLPPPNNASLPVPQEALQSSRAFLASIYPTLSSPNRPFTRSRICWYTDTRTGDFLIDYHPKYKGLFVATGGSGHAFKFLPVLGECVVGCLIGEVAGDFKGLWSWPAERVDEAGWVGDGSRGGPVGMVLEEEMGRGAKL